MSYAVETTARALAEIDEAFGWYVERSVPAAIRWYVKLREAIGSLDDNPERHPLAPESDWYPGEIRHMLYGKKRGMYRILFEVRGDTVFVLRVRHSAQEMLGPDDL